MLKLNEAQKELIENFGSDPCYSILIENNNLVARNRLKIEGSYGSASIAYEREKQISKGYNPEWDRNVNNHKYLVIVARTLTETMTWEDPHGLGYEPEDLLNTFPKNWEPQYCISLLKKPYETRVRIAGALLAAELDRLNLEKEK